MGRSKGPAVIAAWVIALTSALVYGVLAGLAPRTAADLGLLFAVVIMVAWAVLAHSDRRPR